VGIALGAAQLLCAPCFSPHIAGGFTFIWSPGMTLMAIACLVVGSLIWNIYVLVSLLGSDIKEAFQRGPRARSRI
jgi:hypothetical protein